MAILNTPGYSPEEFERDVLPQLFHAPGYAHRVNCREVGADGLSEIVRLLRTRFASVRLRIRGSLMDQDGTATMQAAAVSLVYDVLVVRKDDPRPKHDREELKTQAHCVTEIFEGKLAQSDIVIDTKPIKPADKTEVACIVM